jgi:hypothetical protein
MFQFLFLPGNFPFAVALVTMLAIALIELLGLVVGGSPSSMLESLTGGEADGLTTTLPDDQPGTLASLLSWLRFKEVPMLILLVIFLAAFGVSGLVLQSLAKSVFGETLPAALAAIPALAVSFPVLRGLGGLIAHWMPREETDAVSSDSLVGMVATITLGTARKGGAAEAKLRDGKGQTQFVMVEPDDAGVEFPQGSEVILVRREGSRFTAIANSHDLLGEK